MSTLIFVSLSVMSCFGNVLTENGSTQRCVYDKEVIVRAEDLKQLEERKYLLGTVSKQLTIGCRVTLSNGESYMVGKECRRMIGAK